MSPRLRVPSLPVAITHYCPVFPSFWLPHTVRLTSKPCEFPYVLIDSSRKCTWHLSCSLQVGATLSPSNARDRREEKIAEMIKLVRQLLVIMMLGVLSAGAFAQRNNKDKRPPKEKVVVKESDRKDKRPPPKNNNPPPRPDNRRRP